MSESTTSNDKTAYAQSFAETMQKYFETTTKTKIILSEKIIILSEKIKLYDQLFEQLHDEYGIHVVNCDKCGAMSLSSLEDDLEGCKKCCSQNKIE